MYTSLLLSALCAASLAAPLAQTSDPTNWTPADGSVAQCDKTSDKNIAFFQSSDLDTVITNACAAMMPCAYPNRPADMVCAGTIDIPLQGQEASVQPADIQTSEGNKISGWSAKCKFSARNAVSSRVDVHLVTVTPPENQGPTGVRWRKGDCYGYFEQLLNSGEPQGCHTDGASGVGSITVGGDSSLKGTVFEVEIVEEQ
jgi:hypothetical protein